MKLLKFTLIALLSWTGAQAATIESYETDQLAAVVRSALSLQERYGSDQVLVVLDIDNTLLAMNTALGSDQWFNWQSEVLKSGPTDHLAAADFAGLLKVQGTLFHLGEMRPTEKENSENLEQLEKIRLPLLALTSRGHEFRVSTERELERQALRFSDQRQPWIGFPGKYLPYELQSPEKSGLSIQEVSQMKLGSPRLVSFQEGVYMTAGQHKGAMLRVLLHKLGRSFKAIVFADDQVKNIKTMKEGFSDQNVHLVTFRYSREDAAVENFQKGDKSVVVERWKALEKAIRDAFAPL